MQEIKRETGGSVLLKKHGSDYFRKLAKKSWAKKDARKPIKKSTNRPSK
jgi:hypothetical protein